MLLKVFILLFVIGKSIQSDYGATIKKVFCDFNKDYLANGSCSLKPVKRYVTTQNIEFDLVKELVDIMIRVSVYYKFTIYQPFLIDYTVNYCEFRSKTLLSKVLDVIITNISRYSNNTHPCPFKPPEKFIIKDLVLDRDTFPNFMPVGQYRLDVEFKSSKNVRYALISTFIETRALSLVDLKMG